MNFKTKSIPFVSAIFAVVLLFTTSARLPYSASGVTGKEITYTLNGQTFKGYIAFDAAKKGKRPGILVVHEWWGNNEYPKMRARKLAELGYVALAVDMYGDGRIANDPAKATEYSGEVYKDMNVLKTRLQAGEDKLKTYPEVDATNIGAIGYCFGGGVVLNAAKLGMDFKGVVSFHGSLQGVAPNKDLLKAKILACHGGDDKFESEADVTNFKKQLDSVGADYSFKVYPGALHAFSNPEATALGKKFNLPIAYNAEADKNSWNDMKAFFDGIFRK